MDKKIQLEIVGLSYSQTQSGAFALVLGEVNGNKRLPIIIGSFEAQSIAIQMEGMKPDRPLTHDLFKSLTDAIQVSCKEILIYNLIDGIFYAKIVMVHQGKELELDARPSDAINLAVRYQCPIYVYEFILDRAGIVMEDQDFIFLDKIEEKGKAIGEQSTKKMDFSSLNNSDLKTALEEALSQENYEKAALIRDELNRRTQN
jgi:uncharacterized protein